MQEQPLPCLVHILNTRQVLTHRDLASAPGGATSGLVMHSIQHCWNFKWEAAEGSCSGHCTQHGGGGFCDEQHELRATSTCPLTVEDIQQRDAGSSLLFLLGGGLIAPSLSDCPAAH